MKRSEAFIGLDVHKETIAVAIADAGRNGEVRYWGTMPNTMHHLGQLVTKLAKKHSQLEFTYEAGPCGYDIYRHLKGKGFACQVIAPSHIPRRAGDRVKNDHRDAVTLARVARAGELTAIWVPDPVHEAMRDLVRARHAASTYEAKAWTGRHRLWLAGRRFPHECQQVAFQSYLNAMEQCLSRRSDLEEQIRVACLGNPDPCDMKVYCPEGKETFDDDETTEEAPSRGGRCKLRDADAMLNAGKDLAAVLQALEVSESTLDRWRAQYGGMKCEEAKRLKHLEDENRRLKQLVAAKFSTTRSSRSAGGRSSARRSTYGTT